MNHDPAASAEPLQGNVAFVEEDLYNDLNMSVQEVETARKKLAARVEAARQAAEELPALESKLAAYDAVLDDLKGSATNGQSSLIERAREVARDLTMPTGDMTLMTRGEAIKAVLRLQPGLSPEGIVHALSRGGRENDNGHNVSNELSRLSKRTPPEVERYGRGRWYLTES